MESTKETLHARALTAARNFKEAERELQEALREIDRKKIFYQLGFRSLFEYATAGLGLTPDVAYNHCTVAKKSNELPEVRKAIEQGAVTVAAVRHLAPVLTRENQREMLQLGSSLTQSELRRELAKRNPEQLERPERATFVAEDRVALELRVSEELMKELRRAQDLVSQSERKLASLEETLDAMVELFLKRKDPLEKAKRQAERKSQSLRIIRKNEDKRVNSRRRAIPASVQDAVRLRDEGRCTQETNGKRCNQTRWLHFHHITPLIEGGEHTPENLILLCGGHHRMLHAKN